MSETKYQIIEQRYSEMDVIGTAPSLEIAIEICLEEAESNGYTFDNETREELYNRLVTDMMYVDGDVEIRIVPIK